MDRFKMLGVLLCYNDADILEDNLLHLLNQNHDLLVWDHGSDDETGEILDKYQSHFIERRSIPRSFDFYRLYPEMSANLMKNHVRHYDWISWPDQDEILEGPDRTRKYEDWLREVFMQGVDYIRFNNYNFWFTRKDDPLEASPVKRIRHYSLFPDCAPRIRAWRASATNIREFNHNPTPGREAGLRFNLLHFPVRSEEQMIRRIRKDRAGLQRGNSNYHYNNMAADMKKLIIPPERLHVDDGIRELDPHPVFNWRDIYGYGPVA